MQPGNRDSSLTATTETPSRGGRLDVALARASDAPLREGNRLRLLKDGPNTYDDWLAEIARAERWVHLENYIFRADEVGVVRESGGGRAGSGALRLVRLPGHATSFLASAPGRWG